MANTVSCNVVSVYLAPNKPLRAAVAVMDTIVCVAQLVDVDNTPVNLDGCDVTITATDREKTRLYEAEIIDTASGRIRAVVQPDVPGMFKLTAKVGVTMVADEYTFFLGAFSVAVGETGDPADTIRSLTDDLMDAKEAAELVVDTEQGLYAQVVANAQAAAASAQSAGVSEQTASASATAAAQSAQAAAESASSAIVSALDAAGSKQDAAASALDAAGSAQAAAASEANAAASEQNAQTSADAAAASATAANASATQAALSAQSAAVSAANAAASETNAAGSAANAAASAAGAAVSASNADTSAGNAAVSAAAAAVSETNAARSAQIVGDSIVALSAQGTTVSYTNGDGTSGSFQTQDTIYNDATQSEHGLMSAADKTLVDSIPELGTFNKMFFSQTSGSYTAPRTGVYRITLKGGGGGGGGAQTTTGRSGGGGGEGAINIFYVTLTKNTSYPYSIGAGGAGGISGENYIDISSGVNGGNTTFTANGTTYTAYGGGGGYHSQSTARGGLGGGISPTTGYGIPGANGMGAVFDSFGCMRISGGGHRGGCGADSAIYGGGGGADMLLSASAGANGFILIEYSD